MADGRIKDLAGSVASNQISALLDTLYLAVDDTSFTDAKKILLKTILTEAVVDANTNNYQAMTPKAFYDSVMTTARKGIGQLSLDADVTAKTGTGLLNSVHQVLMQAQWYKDWFIFNDGIPKIYTATDYPLVAGGALSCQSSWKGTLSNGGDVILTPNLPSGVAIKQVYAMICVGIGTQFRYSGAASLYAITTSRVQQLIPVSGFGTNYFYIFITANGTGFGVMVSGTDFANSKVSAQILLNF